jgi:DNA-binding transcriptional MerR regulator
METLDIGEVARRTGLSPSTLRFYEDQGLIAPNGRRGLRRVYPASVLQRLALISLGRAAGFSLAEMATMLPQSGNPKIDKTRLAAKVVEIDLLIRRLSTARRGLQHALECEAPDFMACPHFQRVLAAAERQPLPATPSKVKGLAARRSRRPDRALPTAPPVRAPRTRR